jgi:hypothetical protein
MCLLFTFVIGVALLMPQADPAHNPQLINENFAARVFKVDTPPGPIALPSQKKDNFVIQLSGDGDAKVVFVPMGSNLSPVAALQTHAIIVELSRHWDAEMKACSFPASCVRPIKMGGNEIGSTETLFTNGFVSAFRHRIDAGGTLTSSYYSAKGKDRIIFIPLTAVHVSFDGAEEDLKPEQVYFSEAKEVEVAGEELKPGKWIVIRLNTPRDLDKH